MDWEMECCKVERSGGMEDGMCVEWKIKCIVKWTMEVWWNRRQDYVGMQYGMCDGMGNGMSCGMECGLL